MTSVSVQTLGCKLNQLESEALSEAFEKEGFRLVSEGGADLYIINTCTVTSKAEQKARRMIRKACRDYPESCVIITGCYAQLKARELLSLEQVPDAAAPKSSGRIFVVSGDHKSRILDLPKYFAQSVTSSWELPVTLEQWLAQEDEVLPDDRFRFNVNSFSAHSRAFLKIQDGCNNACTFCSVHLARGKSVSLAPKEVLLRLQTLEEKGYEEAVLTGVNINQYDDEKTDFPRLLHVLLDGTKRIALRISSIEPDLINDDFLNAVMRPRIRPHFHLSVQSGSDTILKSMNRRYTARHVLEAVEKLREVKPDPFLACDMISGFPGESDTDFEQTYILCRQAGFSWIHAFPFSPRPGTAAYRFPHRVPERTAVERVERLIHLAENGRNDYIQRQTGRQLDVIIEEHEKKAGECAAESSYAAGITENYLRAFIPLSGGEVLKPGTAVKCRILSPYFNGDTDPSRIDVIASLQTDRS